MGRMPHFVRDDRASRNFGNAGNYHGHVAVNEWPRERIGLTPSGIESATRLNPIPGCRSRIEARESHDRAIAQNAAKGKHH